MQPVRSCARASRKKSPARWGPLSWAHRAWGRVLRSGITSSVRDRVAGKVVDRGGNGPASEKIQRPQHLEDLQVLVGVHDPLRNHYQEAVIVVHHEASRLLELQPFRTEAHRVGPARNLLGSNEGVLPQGPTRNHQG